MFGKPQISPELLLSMASGISSGNNIQQGMSSMFGNAANIMTVQRQEREAKEVENKTRSWLQKEFPDVDFSQAPPDMMKLYAQEAFKKRFAPPGSNLISVGNGFMYDKETGKYVNPPEGYSQNTTSYGKQPIWFRAPDGKLKLGVPGDDGSLKELQTPEGYEPLPGVSNVDLGTTNVARNNKTGEIVTSSDKDIAGVEEQKVTGKDRGEIKAALPSARFTARVVSDEIKAIIDDPALPQALGPIESRLPTMREETARVESRIKKLAGQSFLQAREMLRGGGQITDFEGKKAEEAMARLDRAQTPEDFKAALLEFDAAVNEGIRKLEAAAEGRDYNPNAETPSGMNTTKTGIPWKVKTP